MANGNENFIVRTMARIRQVMGITSTSDLASPAPVSSSSLHYGMFSNDELRHVDKLSTSPLSRREVTAQDIVTQLADVANSSRKTIEEIDTLKKMSPEISTAEEIIVSSIMSPVDLQTDAVSVTIDYPIGEDSKNKINELLTNFFNDEYRLGPKLYEWLKTASFHDGAKAILIVPQRTIDVLNTVADDWDPQYKDIIAKNNKAIAASTESLVPNIDEKDMKETIESLGLIAAETLKHANVGSDFYSEDQKKKHNLKDETGKTVSLESISADSIAKNLISSSFKLLKHTSDNQGVIVTRDMSALVKGQTVVSSKVASLQEEAERQVFGYDKKNPAQSKEQFPVLCVSDIIQAGEDDLPIVVELPTDSVIPVCAPGDSKNHLGYFVMVNEFGQPIRGEQAFDLTPNTDMSNRLATNAARSVFGNNSMVSFKSAGLTEAQTMDNLSNVFSVAVNFLLKSKLNKDGLKGLQLSIHESVGKALFFNLLAKNAIKMIFIPEPMMVYYRLDHRKDGTGKTLLEDVDYLMALRCTLLMAKVMAVIDNATKHRTIEVQVDEKQTNPFEVLEAARHIFINKRVPNITNNPRTAAESIISSHLTIRPKGLPGVVDDLSVNQDSHYGNSQAPDGELLEKLNNMIGLGLGVPPSALNSLNESEFSRSVATINLFFANKVRNWQATIRPYNKKFLINYILCNSKLLKEITDVIEKDLKGNDTPKVQENTSDCIRKDQDVKASEIVKKVLSTVELVLNPPNMSSSKSQFDELNSHAEAVEKIMNMLYPDDLAVDGDLKTYMSALRALASSKIMRQYLPKLGVHEVADIPSIDEIDTDQVTKVITFLGNVQRRANDLTKLIKGELPPTQPSGDDPMPTDDTSTSTEPTDDMGTGGEDDMSGIPGFEP
jgi:hypothetical protein